VVLEQERLFVSLIPPANKVVHLLMALRCVVVLPVEGSDLKGTMGRQSSRNVKRDATNVISMYSNPVYN